MSINVWQKHGVVVAPVLSDTPGQPNVLYEPGAVILSGTVFKMWFGSANGICYAESADGLTWTRYSGNPIISMAQGFPTLEKVAGTYYLYTNVLDGKMACYTSTDGIAFTLQNATALVIDQAWEGSEFIGQIHLADIIGGVWTAYYSANTATGTYGTGRATSTDGIHWTKYSGNPVINPTYQASGMFIKKIGSSYYGWAQIVQAGIPSHGSLGLPSDVTRFWSSSINGPWTPLSVSTLYRTTDAEGVALDVGQIADTHIIEVSGTVYCYNTINNLGTGNTGYQIACATAPAMTLAQLVTTYEGVKDVPFPTTAGLALNLNTLASDNFNRANADPIGGNWSQFSSATFFTSSKIVSNALESSTVGSGGDSFYNAIAWPNDQWAQGTVKACANSSFAIVDLRLNVSGIETGYRCYWNGTAGGAGTFAIQKALAGVFTTVGQTTGIVLSTSDAITAVVIDGVISVYQNANLVLSATDVSPIASGDAGLGPLPITAFSDVIFDDWSGGGVQAAPTPPGPTFNISGNVGTAGATVSYTGPSSGSVIADGSGNYSIPNLADGAYILAPTLAGYIFSPTRVTVVVADANFPNVNFVATKAPVGDFLLSSTMGFMIGVTSGSK